MFNATSTRESPCPLFVRIVLEVGKCIRMIYRMDSDIVATHCDILATHCDILATDCNILSNNATHCNTYTQNES